MLFAVGQQEEPRLAARKFTGAVIMKIFKDRKGSNKAAEYKRWKMVSMPLLSTPATHSRI